MKTNIYIPILALFAGFILTACDTTNDPPPALPIIENIEIGLSNNGIGVIGRDFHFDMDVVAGDLIEDVRIEIQQRNDEVYSHEWSFEITWDQYNGLKNTNVHKHFDISEDAAEGTYDFVITVNDQNGEQLEEVRAIDIYLPENLPVDPTLHSFSVSARIDDEFRVLYTLAQGYRAPVTQEYGDYSVHINENETLSASATISGIKDDGQIYILLINKKHNHQPESITDIDFSKVIVIDTFVHSNMNQTERWSNVHFERPNFTDVSKLLIGAETDNNSPNPNPITDLKAWESGDYYVGVIYENTTHNFTLFQYIEMKIKGF